MKGGIRIVFLIGYLVEVAVEGSEPSKDRGNEWENSRDGQKRVGATNTADTCERWKKMSSSSRLNQKDGQSSWLHRPSVDTFCCYHARLTTLLSTYQPVRVMVRSKCLIDQRREREDWRYKRMRFLFCDRFGKLIWSASRSMFFSRVHRVRWVQKYELYGPRDWYAKITSVASSVGVAALEMTTPMRGASWVILLRPPRESEGWCNCY